MTVDLPALRRQAELASPKFGTEIGGEELLALVTAAEALIELEQRGYVSADSRPQNAARAAVEALRGAA